VTDAKVETEIALGGFAFQRCNSTNRLEQLCAVVEAGQACDWKTPGARGWWTDS
jgi:hypothetical protein